MAALANFSVVEPTATDDRLRWFQTEVKGRKAVGAVGGRDGPPVVFLHGWALGSHTYKRALSRLLTRGCRVFAPALPSFGGTADLPASEATLSGYGDWVSEFMEAVGIDEPALVIGHSFGGGVAIKLATRRPEKVSYLVLLNAVGGLSSRPPWEWIAGLARELWPPTSGADLAWAIRSDLLPNVAGNPCGVLRIARVAQQADLRQDAQELRAGGLPVLVLTSQGDEVIPRAAFETLCDAIGTDGRVVRGGHSWMLADPDSLIGAIAPVIDDQVKTYQRSRATTLAAELADLMVTMRVPRRRAAELVRDAPPLWLLSESPPVLAADLAICHPKLRTDEVRAVGRQMADSSLVRITIVASDRKGLLADSAGVLAAGGLSIVHASAATWQKRGLALHSFVVEAGPLRSDAAWRDLGRHLRVMATTRPLSPVRTSPPERVTVLGGDRDQMLVTVTVKDEPGALSNLCRRFSDHGINIESLHAKSVGRRAIDTFLVSGVSEATDVQRIFDSRTGATTQEPSPPRRAAQRAWAPVNRSASSAHLTVVVG
ncbi:MAG TPA: alpha/beta fold hydrolase [Acidimicrobiales bacterium]|nr:alpha/beta fold hydrolase [Acidimicrobiales bacterium]